MKKGFTITELIVAIGLLAAVLAASSMIFHYSVDAQRVAAATAEIMRTCRAITDQLNADFAGLRKIDAPMIMKFEGDLNDSNKADSVVFFTVGGFQTANLYSGDTVRGNVARVYYGQAEPNHLSTGEMDRRNKILVRRQVIVAPSESNDSNEYDPNSLSLQMLSYRQDHNGVSDGWLQRPGEIDPNDSNDIAMFLARGVDDFSIAFCDRSIGAGGDITWQMPPDGMKEYFGFDGLDNDFAPYPDLIKFTFTLYDSKRILKGGRRFEHVVYIGN